MSLYDGVGDRKGMAVMWAVIWYRGQGRAAKVVLRPLPITAVTPTKAGGRLAVRVGGKMDPCFRRDDIQCVDIDEYF